MFRMRLFQRNGWFHVEYARNRSKALRTKDPQKAKAIFEEMEAEHLRGRLLLLDKKERLSLTDFAKIYTSDPDRSELSESTLKNDIIAITALKDVAGDIPIKLITRDTIKEFKAHSLGRMKKVSVNTYLARIKAGLEWAKAEGYLDRVPPIKKYKMARSLPRPIPQDDVKRILATAKKKDMEMYRVITFALFTGCRRAEIVRARYDHINGDTITVVGKGDKERSFYLLPQALPDRKDIGKIFKYSHVSTLSNYFRDKIVRPLGINARFHDLRHTAATTMLANGIDLEMVQKILGHTDIRTTQLYADVLQENIEKQMSKMKGVTFE